MKIIKRGELPDEKTYRGKCHFCKTEIEFQRKEAKVVYDQRDGDFLSIACPLCDNTINTAV